MPLCTIVRGNVVIDHGDILSKPVGKLVKPDRARKRNKAEDTSANRHRKRNLPSLAS